MVSYLAKQEAQELLLPLDIGRHIYVMCFGASSGDGYDDMPGWGSQ